MVADGHGMVQLTDIHSLTDFLRNHRRHVARLKRGRRPEVLTINGTAALVVQDAKSYQELLNALDQAEAIAGIRRGLEEMEAGRGRPASEFFAALRKKHRVPKHAK